jgi:hypothetical protein
MSASGLTVIEGLGSTGLSPLEGVGGGGLSAASQTVVWTNPYPEIISASSSYTNGRDTSYVNTAAIGNAFALAVANKWLIYQRVAGPFGQLYDCIPAPAYQVTAFDAQQAAEAMPGTPTFDTIAADYFYHATKFKNRVAGELAPDLNIFGVSNPNWIAPEMWSLGACTRTASVIGPDGSTPNAVSFTTSGTASALLRADVPLGRWTLAIDIKADANCTADIGVGVTGNTSCAITTAWQTFTDTSEFTTESSNNDFLYLLRNAPTGRVITIANIRLTPGGTAGAVSAFNRNGTLLGNGGTIYGAINQNGMFVKNRQDLSAADQGMFMIPWVDGVGTLHTAMSLVAAVNMTGAYASTNIEPIVSALPESGSDYQSRFFVGTMGTRDQFSCGGTTQNGPRTYSTSLKGADWMIVSAVCDGTRSRLWFNEICVADSERPWVSGATSPWAGSTHRAIQAFMSGPSTLRTLNADLCSLTIWNSSLSDSDRAAAYAQAKARIEAHGATHVEPSTFLVTDGDSISQPGATNWPYLTGREVHYAPTLQGWNFAIANAALGTTADSGTTNTIWRRLVPLRTKIAEALDAGSKVIVVVNIGANNVTDSMLTVYQNATNGIQKYYQAVTATTYGGVTYSAPSNVLLVGSTVAPQRLVADGGSLTPTQEAARDNTNAYILTLSADVDDFVDWDAVFSGVWSAPNFTDNVHPNATGQGLLRDATDTVVFPLWVA